MSKWLGIPVVINYNFMDPGEHILLDYLYLLRQSLFNSILKSKILCDEKY